MVIIQDMPLPHELRPPPVLEKTMIYLLNNIAEMGGDGRWADWYDFLWSRTRGIRKVSVRLALTKQGIIVWNFRL